ncbi:MAG: adenosylmethionine--8-amino-7-oxononanoate transaminase [Gammaproteobacteria bacterium]|nr:adenosylmethionine--8-amino-7-oxononanoate transaminase [Gammaproteobacteria bacterium]
MSFDHHHIWHPYTSMTNPGPVWPVRSASGVRLCLEDGRELIDGMSSWWAVIHGYNHPRLNQALQQQMEQMSHVMFGGLIHQPAVDLARLLIDITPDSLQHIFFADSGSVAVEVAIKMATQFWFAQGYPQKSRLLTIRQGYHGDTFGAMAVCDPESGMHHQFTHLLAKHFFVAAPVCRDDDSWQDSELDEIKTRLQQSHNEISAIILEPLVQGAGGMRFYCPQYLTAIRALCDQYDILLIVDEIATGFGRTGTLFACEQAAIEPDIMCLGKALTGGYLTLAATLTSTRVAEGISADGQGVLMHGPTFMANPLACAVAIASVELLLEGDWQQQVANIEQQLTVGLMCNLDFDHVRDVRVKGAIGVIEFKQKIDMAWMQPFLVEQGVWIRPFNNLLYIMPPYIIDNNDLGILIRAMNQGVRALDFKIKCSDPLIL